MMSLAGGNRAWHIAGEKEIKFILQFDSKRKVLKGDTKSMVIAITFVTPPL